MWDVVYLPEAESERLMLPTVERNALIHAVEKLETFGPQLGYPHTSACKDSPDCVSCVRAQAVVRGGPCIGVWVKCL
jgi:hypothetical protein